MDYGRIELAVRTVRDKAGFIQKLLRDGLGWPIEDGVKEPEDIAYGWSGEELKIDDLDEHFVDGQVWQLQPLDPGREQRWGIFLLEFNKPDVFTKGRGITGPLRRILRRLVPKRRQQPAHKVWQRKHLLFLCTHNYEHFSVAYFKDPPEGGKTPPLAIFGWGPDIPSRTAVKFNLPALDWPAEDVSPDVWVTKWASAFDVEKVTRKFYEEYAAVFMAVEDIIADHSDLAGDDLRVFTQMLFNRLMFLRFIERKGWLELRKKPNYLQELYTTTPPKESFYKTRLRRLFFEGLAQENHQAADVIGKVPFLNGGLFEQTPLDKKVDDIPNIAFDPILSKKDGIFYHYNFTVEESTPLDIQVAVDPEMLGKVFEELVTGRHETGSYYTPRPVVAFMCREALKGYLADKTGVSAEAIARLVDKHDVTSLTETNARKVIEALDGLKAVDPACGSGAYLLGLLQEMIALYRLLYSEKLKRDSRSLYDLKLRIISNNLYGVDIDPFATNIAMLRLWLSIAVDSDKPLPLPNLDFKIETGDSLLGPCREFQKEFSAYLLEQRARRLIAKKDEYLRSHGSKKEQLYDYIRTEEEEIAGECQLHFGKDVIAWPVHFAEIFFAEPEKTEATFKGEFGFVADQGQQKALKQTLDSKPGGFDIVLANPPYVRQELIKSLKPGLRRMFPATYLGTADLYCFFYARSFELLRRGGMLVFISSNKWFRAAYGRKIRDHIAGTCDVLSITDFKDLPVFQTAIAYAMIFVARKGRTGVSTVLTEPPSLEMPYPDIGAVVKKHGRPLPPEALNSPLWSFGVSGKAIVRAKIMGSGVPLRDYVGSRVFRGLTTGFNEAFVLDGATRKRLILEDKKSKDIIKPLALGRDVTRWSIATGDRWMIVTPIDVDMKRYPAVLAHLKTWETELRKRYDQGKRWWELRACDYYDAFEKPKIVSTKVSIRPTFAIDTGNRYLGNTAYFLPVQKDALYVLGLLNSAVFYAYSKEVFVEKQNGWYEVQPTGLETFPIPPASREQKRTLVNLVERCIGAAGDNCDAWEAEIDELAASLYGLKAEDLHAVRQLEAEVESNQPEKVADSKEYKAYLKEQFGA